MTKIDFQIPFEPYEFPHVHSEDNQLVGYTSECKHCHHYVELDADVNEIYICMIAGDRPEVCRFDDGECPLPEGGCSDER